MAVTKDYKRRIQSANRSASVSAGYAVDPVHVPNGGVTNWEVCPAGSVITLMSINVAPGSGGVYLSFANGDLIVSGAVTARDYKMHFYCPMVVNVSTPGQGEDVTFYVAPASKGDTNA